MPVEIFKSKSIVPEKTDWEIANGTHALRFISFEAIVKLFKEKYDIKDKPLGYRVTEQGVEIVTD